MNAPAPGTRPRRFLLIEGSHIAALWGLAVVQPTFALLAHEENVSYFFASRRLGGLGFVVVVAAFVIIPPLALIAIEAVMGRWTEDARRRLHRFLVFVFLFLFALYALEQVAASAAADETGALLLLAAAAVAGGLGTWLYCTREAIRSMLTVLSPAPLLSLALLLFFSPASGLVLGSASDQPVPAQQGRIPVVLVAFDELPVSTLMNRRGKIDNERFPNFARLARGSTWFRNTIAAADHTVQAVPSIFSGIQWKPGKPPVYISDSRGIFRLLGQSHRVHASEHATWLCPPRICPVATSELARGLQVASALSLVYPDVVVPDGLVARLGIGKPDVGRTWGAALRPEDPGRSVDELITATKGEPSELNRYYDAQFEEFVEGIGPYEPGQGPPPAYLFHAGLPHLPWIHLPSGQVYASFREPTPGQNVGGDEQWGPKRALVEMGWQRHLLQSRFTDRLLGRLVAKLRRVGLYDRSLVVVTADHGASFKPGGNRRFVSKKNGGDVALVPFFVKSPGQHRGLTVDRPVRTTDVTPTIAEVVGAHPPWRADGKSAFLRSASPETVRIVGYAGEDLKISPVELERVRAATLRRQVSLFGTGLDGGAGFGLGPYKNLVGRPISDVSVSATSDARVWLSDPGTLKSVRLESRFLPASRIRGKIRGARPAWIALAMNGRIASVTRPIVDGSVVSFSLLTSRQGLTAGSNSVSIYGLAGRPEQARLVPLRIANYP